MGGDRGVAQPVLVVISQFIGVSNLQAVRLKLTQDDVSIISNKAGVRGKL